MKHCFFENRYGLTVAYMAAIILLPFLGIAPLMDPNEPVYGQTAKEMLLAGDWLSPRIYGQFWYDKPPLFYWLEMLSYSLLGISDWSSRLPSAVAAVTTALFVYVQGKDLFNQTIAFMATLILLTSVGFMYVGKAAVTDMTLMLTLTVAMISLYQGKYYRAYAFCGLALLAKGPVGYAFPALIMLLYMAATRQWALLRTMKIPQGLCIAFLVGLPWYVFMYQTHGDIFLQTFLGYHNLVRFIAPEHPGQNSIFFFIPVFIGAMVPWIPALAPAVRRLFKKRDPFNDTVLFCLIWAAFIFVFFSLSHTQLVTYIAPAFPPAAYIIAWYLYRCYLEKRPPLGAIAAAYILAVGLLLCNAIPLNEGAEFFAQPILIGSVLLSTALFLPAFLLYRQLWKQAFASAVVLMVVFSWAAFGFVMPRIAEHTTSYEAAYILHDVYDGRSDLYIEKFLRPGIAYYSNLHGIEWQKDDLPDFAALLTSPDKAYIVMTKTSFLKLNQTVPELRQYGMAADLPAQVILINHP